MHYSPTLLRIPALSVCARTLAERVHWGISDDPHNPTHLHSYSFHRPRKDGRLNQPYCHRGKNIWIFLLWEFLGTKLRIFKKLQLQLWHIFHFLNAMFLFVLACVELQKMNEQLQMLAKPQPSIQVFYLFVYFKCFICKMNSF